MTDVTSIALAQLNPHLGNIEENVARLLDARRDAAAVGADIIVTPEMYLSGYPCDDLVLRSDFMSEVASGLDDLAAATADGGPAIIVGAPHAENGVITNAVFVIDEGAIKARRDKVNLPNYGVFDDKRNFVPGAMPGPVLVRGRRLGLPICEDIWTPDVIECLAESGAEIIISLNASPFDQLKSDSRMAHAVSRAVESELPFIYVNMVGGQDELVFDGASFALSADGSLAAHLPSFSEATVTIRVGEDFGASSLTGQMTPPDEGMAALYRGLTMGLRDYVDKNGFPGVVLGLSGGIDSALVAALAVDALGPDRVHAVMMPSPYTSTESLEDAADLAGRLGIRLDEVSIGPAMDAMDGMLAQQFGDAAAGIAEENIQSRLRGMILMGISNKHGPMVLATGNKSEYAAGYSTLYGDMCGGFAPIKDVWKVEVFDLCRWRNANMPRGGAGPEGEIIPVRIIEKPPSAELRPDQKDTDSLPPYERLDDIMRALCEEMVDTETIIARGHDRDEVARASQLLFRAEYKRFQAAPGPKMTALAFGRERRLPLTSGFNPLQVAGKEELMSKVKVRFAPSPTGNLHVGNLRTALVNYLFARRVGGHFMLRIDDTDTERSTAEFEASIRSDLGWMGMQWDSEDRQSERLDRYDAALQKLAADGRAYACYETQEELALKRKAQLSAGRPPVYDRAALKLSEAQKAQFESEGRRPHWRFLLDHAEVAWSDMVRGDVSYHMSSLSDPVLMREDGRVIYTMASVVDDIDHEITHIIRGEDHVTNSAAQIQLFEALGGTAPVMGHVALLAGADGEGLSKRLGSLSIAQLRDEGTEPEALASLLARIGTADPVVACADMAAIIDGFDLSRFGRATAKFDPAELAQVNVKIVQQLGFDAVVSRLSSLGVEGGAAFWLAVRDNVLTVEEAAHWWRVCTTPLEPVIDAADVTDAAAAALPEGDLDGVWGAWTKSVSTATGAKGRGLFMPIRLALTGQEKGPEIGPLLPFIGRDRILARLRGETA